MKRILSLMVLSIAVVASLAGCRSTPRATDAERLAFYEAHAGEPVRNFRLFGRLTGWTPLGNSALLVWPRPNQAYLLDVTTCQDLPFASAISISHFASTVTARFDTVTPHGAGLTAPGRIPCRITQIRPIDTQAVRDTREEMRQAEAEARSEAPPAEEPPSN